MTPRLTVFSIVASLGLAAIPALAQGERGLAPTPDYVVKPDAADGEARRPKKAPAARKKPENGAGLPQSEEAEKAARLAEGRKKFFDSTSGFGSDGRSLPMSLDQEGRPAMGFKF